MQLGKEYLREMQGRLSVARGRSGESLSLGSQTLQRLHRYRDSRRSRPLLILLHTDAVLIPRQLAYLLTMRGPSSSDVMDSGCSARSPQLRRNVAERSIAAQPRASKTQPRGVHATKSEVCLMIRLEDDYPISKDCTDSAG
jgi:hypothetical protein